MLRVADSAGDARARCHGGGYIGQIPVSHHVELAQRLGLRGIWGAACDFRVADVSTGAFVPCGPGVGSAVRTDLGLESPPVLGVRLDLGGRVYRSLPRIARSYLAGQLTVSEQNRVNVFERTAR